MLVAFVGTQRLNCEGEAMAKRIALSNQKHSTKTIKESYLTIQKCPEFAVVSSTAVRM